MSKLGISGKLSNTQAGSRRREWNLFPGIWTVCQVPQGIQCQCSHRLSYRANRWEPTQIVILLIIKLIIITKFTEQDFATFLEYYRRTFPDATILPKMHIMEDHIPWLKRWHTGAGLMGEQGAESIHAHFMKLETRYQTIANPVDRLKYIFTQQILESEPSLVALRPPPQKRIKTSEE